MTLTACGDCKMRTDIHRPSAIVPEDYEFVGCEVVKIEDMGSVAMMQSERERIRAHMARTGGRYSTHAHGGNCHVCGNANAIYTVLFWHQPTNVYIRVGQDCADKMDCGDPTMFRRLSALRDGVQADRQTRAGKAKAEAILADAGLTQAWTAYVAERQDSDCRAHDILRDIVGKLVKYGSISDAQINFLRRLVDQIAHQPQIEDQRKAEHEAAEPVPVTDKRIALCGTILAIKQGEFDNSVRMLVKHPDGFKLWGSLPASLSDAEVGDTVEFFATVRPSDRDPKFGFFSRPTKARKGALENVR